MNAEFVVVRVSDTWRRTAKQGMRDESQAILFSKT